MATQSLATATVGGQTGPAKTFASLALPNVKQLNLDFAASSGRVNWVTNDGRPRTLDFDLILTTTLTDTITSLVNAITIAGA